MTVLTPVQLQPDTLFALHSAHPRRYPILFQSIARGEPLGRYDILLACPREWLTLTHDGKLVNNAGLDSADTFLATLDRWWLREQIPAEPVGLPFSGGWFLYLGYELAQEIEPTLKLRSEHIVAQAIRIPAALIVRHSDQTAWIVEESASEHCGRQIAADISALSLPLGHREFPLVRQLAEDPDQCYLDAVSAALRCIAAGDIYQANLSRAWKGRLADEVRPCDIYQRLRQTNPAPFAALAVLDDFAVVSSSPERLIEVREGAIATRPIAGTRPRGATGLDDAARLRELHSHPKERAEHVMLIDLERNDLGRVCEPGTIEVNEFMTLESYAHVHHIVSNVRGRLRSGVTPGEIIAAVFPGGTITGCPKVRCMEIISELERAPRGAYTGSLGYLNRDGSMDLSILIRSIEVRDRELTLRAGAGIVADSIPERELEETRAKARGVVAALTC